MVLRKKTRISILNKALKLIYASNINEVDAELEWDEPWHKDVIVELDKKIDDDNNSFNKDLIKIYDNDNNLLLKLNILNKAGESPFLGEGAFTKVYNVDYNGKECALKIIKQSSTGVGRGDISIDVYKKLLSIKNNLPNDWGKYIPEIYFMKENVSIHTYNGNLSGGISVIIMEKLKHLSTVKDLTSSFSGSYSNNPNFDKSIYFEVISKFFEDIKKSYLNEHNLMNTFYKLKYKKYIIYLKSIFLHSIDEKEYIKYHIKNNISDNMIVTGIFEWILNNIKINVEVKIYDNNQPNVLLKTDNIELNPSTLLKINDSINGFKNIDVKYIRAKNIIEEKIGIKLDNMQDINDIFWNLISKHLQLMKNILNSVDYFLNVDSKKYINIKFPIKADEDEFDTYNVENNINRKDTEEYEAMEYNQDKKEPIINIEFQEFYEFLKYINDHYNISWRDLHSSNIMIGTDGNYKLSDVGLFRI